MQQEFDRRAQERMAVTTETKCTFVSPVLEDFGPGRIHNISMDGLALLLTSRVQPGTLMAVTLVNEARGFQKTVMLRVDIRRAAMQYGEVQAVGRDGAVEQVMRRARVLGARGAARIAQGAHDVLLESRRCLQDRCDGTRRRGPGCVLQRFGRRGRGASGAGRGRAGNQHPAPEQRATIDEAVAGDDLQIRWWGFRLLDFHGFLRRGTRRPPRVV